MANKKKPAKKAAAKTVSRRPERSKGELSSDDLDSVAGGVMTLNTNVGIKSPFDIIKKVEQKLVSDDGMTLSTNPIKILPR